MGKYVIDEEISFGFSGQDGKWLSGSIPAGVIDSDTLTGTQLEWLLNHAVDFGRARPATEEENSGRSSE